MYASGFRLSINHITIISTIIFILATYFLPPIGKLSEISLLLSAISIIFGILVGFTLNNLWARLNRMRELIASECSQLENLYQLSKYFGEEYTKKLSDIMDYYLIKAFNYELWEYEEHINEDFFKIFDSIKDDLKPTTDRTKQAFGQILNIFEDLSTTRKEITALGNSRLKPYEWVVIMLLGSLLIINIFYIKETTAISYLFTTLLSIMVIMVLAVIRDLNDLEWNIEVIGYQPYEEIFDLIGKPRYFPSESLIRNRTLNKGPYYRMGVPLSETKRDITWYKDGKEIKREVIDYK